MTQDTLYRVLSIQSHVVHGNVGNKSVTFPLQLLGYEVDAINSVQFSNHTAYSYHSGQVLNNDQLWDVYNGLKRNNIVQQYTHLLTGYIGSTSFLKKVKQLILDIRAVNPNIIYVCDPVLGDNGKMYVDQELLPIYKNEIIPLANIITPNQFEIEKLTDQIISNECDAVKAMSIILESGPKIVVISSAVLNEDKAVDKLSIFLASIDKDTGKIKNITCKVSKIDCYFVGSGDLFTSLLMARITQYPEDLKRACSSALSSVRHILQDTNDWGNRDGRKGDFNDVELKIIQNRKCIEEPVMNITFKDI